VFAVLALLNALLAYEDALLAALRTQVSVALFAASYAACANVFAVLALLKAPFA